MKRIISLIIENQPGALSRVVGLFSQRSFNIDSLTVAPTEDVSLSRLTVVTSGDAKIAEQISKQLNKIIDVLKVFELTEVSHVERELMLIKVKAVSPAQRDELKRTADIFRAHIVDVTPSTYTIQMVGDGEKLDAFINTISQVFNIVETARTGVIGLGRGEKTAR